MEAKSGDADVPDSTDWLGTPLAGLMPVEQAFRCHVCKDFYSSPMITSCNHTFCSLCIRRCLSVDGKCPLCRAVDQESKLRGNWALREAVDAFCKARIEALAVARLSTTDSKPPKRKAAEDAGNGPDSKRTRMSTRLSKTRAAEMTTAMAQEEIEIADSSDNPDYEPDDGLVACPICWSRMKPYQVDRHIDRSCPGSPQPKSARTGGGSGGGSSSKAFGSSSFAPLPRAAEAERPAKAPERLPSTNYSLLNDTALRKKMAALGISTTGSRQLLERRHKEWTTIWNANCDSAQPKRKLELLHDLDVWERTLGGRAVTLRPGNPGSQVKDKEFDGTAWAAKHDASFKDLIAKAKKSRLKAEPRPSEQPASSSQADEQSANRQPEMVIIDAEEPAGLSHVEQVNAEIVAPVVKAAEQHQEGDSKASIKDDLRGIPKGEIEVSTNATAGDERGMAFA